MKYFYTIIFLLITYLASAQNSVDYNNDNRRVYWFDVALKTEKDPDTRIPIYSVYTLGAKVKYGTAEEYDRYLWTGLSDGSKIAVGPFNSLEQATQAKKLYNLDKAEKDTTIMNNNGTFFWYLVTIKKTQRLKSYDFERIPAKVVEGSYSEFIELMKVSLPVNKLVIGAFESAPEAENSKRIFRLAE